METTAPGQFPKVKVRTALTVILFLLVQFAAVLDIAAKILLAVITMARAALIRVTVGVMAVKAASHNAVKLDMVVAAVRGATQVMVAVAVTAVIVEAFRIANHLQQAPVVGEQAVLAADTRMALTAIAVAVVVAVV